MAGDILLFIRGSKRQPTGAKLQHGDNTRSKQLRPKRPNEQPLWCSRTQSVRHIKRTVPFITEPIWGGFRGDIFLQCQKFQTGNFKCDYKDRRHELHPILETIFKSFFFFFLRRSLSVMKRRISAPCCRFHHVPHSTEITPSPLSCLSPAPENNSHNHLYWRRSANLFVLSAGFLLCCNVDKIASCKYDRR